MKDRSKAVSWLCPSCDCEMDSTAGYPENPLDRLCLRCKKKALEGEEELKDFCNMGALTIRRTLG